MRRVAGAADQPGADDQAAGVAERGTDGILARDLGGAVLLGAVVAVGVERGEDGRRLVRAELGLRRVDAGRRDEHVAVGHGSEVAHGSTHVAGLARHVDDGIPAFYRDVSQGVVGVAVGRDEAHTVGGGGAPPGHARDVMPAGDGLRRDVPTEPGGASENE